jgi:NAD(P)H-dependent FMN reductase
MKISSTVFLSLSLLVVAVCGGILHLQATPGAQQSTKTALKIILGTTRHGRTSDKIGALLKGMIEQRTDVEVEVLDLRDFNLPFLNDEVAPAYRTAITDPVVQKWADAIAQAQAFIIVVPEYNAGYPGVLKNALDTLYKEWNGKAVAFVGYSGGATGGNSAIAQLRTVTDALKMDSIAQTITIPTAWKAFDKKGNLLNTAIEKDVNEVVDQLVAHRCVKK